MRRPVDTNSDYDSAPDQYDNGHDDDLEEDDEDEDDEDSEDEYEDGGAGAEETDRAIATLQGQAQRTSVLVPNPINMMAATVTTSNEDDDYDNI